MGPQLLQHLIAVAARLHVDEVHHDDPADVPQPQLARHFASRLEVRLEDRALGVLLAGITAGVHVDRGQRLGGLDDEVSAGRQLYPRDEELADLRFDVVLVEQRGPAACSFTRSIRSGSICFKYCTTSLCNIFESTSSESTLSLKRSRMMPRVRLVSRCSSAGGRARLALRLVFFHISYRWSVSGLELCSVRSSATVRMIQPPESLGTSLATMSRSLARWSRFSILRETPTFEANGM